MEDDRPEQPQVPRDPQNPQARELDPRGVFGIVNEAFAIYGARFRSLIALNAIIQLPVAILTLLPSDNEAVFLTVNFISAVVLAFAGAATIYTVGQHYLSNRVVIGVCYARTLWRAVSIAILGLISAAITTALIAVAPVGEVDPETVSLAQILIVSTLIAVLIFLSIYLTMAAPAVMYEGFRSLGMLRRGFELARGSELRILGNLLVYGLVLAGMAIVIILPFGIAASVLSAGEDISVVGDLLLNAGQIAVSILVTPLIYVAFTLLYFDIRVRREGFSISQLSHEMGMAPEPTEYIERIETENTEEEENSDNARDG